MNFVINRILLWLENGELRELCFLPNKVNVLTGASNTGKSTLLHIIDYCFCKSTGASKITEEVINENVAWYGINFTINDTCYTLARGKVVDGLLSTQFYLSAAGEIPERPTATIGEAEVKKRLETEFSIDSSIVIPYGGKILKAGTKISFRYFLLFNTQSSRVIDDEEQFFDKIQEPRYKEALDRIFSLALGAVNQESVLIAEEIAKLTKELAAVERKDELFARQRGVFESNLIELIAKAQSVGLIDGGLPTLIEGQRVLQGIVSNYMNSYRRDSLREVDNLQQERRDIIRKLKNIDAFEANYEQYRQLMAGNADSLQPVLALRNSISELLLVPPVATLFNQLQERLSRLKSELEARRPFAINISEEKNELEAALVSIDEQLQLYPSKAPDFAGEAERLMMVGEIKAKLELYTQVADDLDFSTQMLDKANAIEELEAKARTLPDGKQLALELLHDRIQSYINKSTSLGIYQTYRAFFNEREKVLQVRSPSSLAGSLQPSAVGSSSNYLFLHLCLFLGLHDYFLLRKSKYVPQFLILDQLSRPYYEEVRKKNPDLLPEHDLEDELLENDDRKKLTEAFLMLDQFITYSVDDLKQNFQFIVLEHVSPDFCQEIGMQNFHLVEHFRLGNALIPRP